MQWLYSIPFSLLFSLGGQQWLKQDPQSSVDWSTSWTTAAVQALAFLYFPLGPGASGAGLANLRSCIDFYTNCATAAGHAVVVLYLPSYFLSGPTVAEQDPQIICWFVHQLGYCCCPSTGFPLFSLGARSQCSRTHKLKIMHWLLYQLCYCHWSCSGCTLALFLPIFSWCQQRLEQDPQIIC